MLKELFQNGDPKIDALWAAMDAFRDGVDIPDDMTLIQIIRKTGDRVPIS